jgi:hypothetical protein
MKNEKLNLAESTAMTERHVLQDAIRIGRVHHLRRAQRAAAFRIFALQQMAFARTHAQHFAPSSDFETFAHGLPRLDTFGASHKWFFLIKRARNIGCTHPVSKR